MTCLHVFTGFPTMNSSFSSPGRISKPPSFSLRLKLTFRYSVCTKDSQEPSTSSLEPHGERVAFRGSPPFFLPDLSLSRAERTARHDLVFCRHVGFWNLRVWRLQHY